MHCEDELLSLLIKVDWPMAKQDLGQREGWAEKGGVRGDARRRRESSM